MTNTTRNKLFIGFFVIAIFMIALTFGILSSGVTKAFAATTPKYTMTFSGTHTNLGWGANGLQSQLTNQTKVSVPVTWTSGDKEDVIMYLSGSSVSGTATLANYGYIKSSQVTLSSSVGATMKIYNNLGNLVASGNNTITVTLSDGLYKATLDKTKQSGAGYTKWGYSLSLYSYFYVDANAPTVNGASTSTTGKYTNQSFSVFVSDSMSGVQALYYKMPGQTSYQSTSATSKLIPAGSVNGLYSFYAIDKAGNRSSTYYVIYDNTAPSGSIKSSGGTTLASLYTNSAFYYTATDASSGISYLQYKTPSSSSWLTYTSGTNIPATSTNGKYTFRA